MYDPNAAMEDGREELMRELSARMVTRGPDGSGYYGSKRYGKSALATAQATLGDEHPTTLHLKQWWG